MVVSQQSEFQQRLTAELDEAGFILSTAEWREWFAGVSDPGTREYERIRDLLGSDWEDVTSHFRRASREEHHHGQIGGGFITAKYLAAPLDISPENMERLGRLGANMIYIVGHFDWLVDDGYDHRRVMSKLGQLVAMTGIKPLTSLYDYFASGLDRCFTRIFADYYHELTALPHAGDRPEVRQKHDEMVEEMCRAERASVTGVDTAETNRITSSHPFVVIGLPAWLATPTFRADRYRAHLDWLEEFGRLLWFMDDAADIHEDRREGFYNEVTARRRREPDQAVIDDIVSCAKQVRSGWSSRVDESACPDLVSKTLAARITKWMGDPIDD